jgi:ferrous iron transport protein A
MQTQAMVQSARSASTSVSASPASLAGAARSPRLVRHDASGASGNSLAVQPTMTPCRVVEVDAPAGAPEWGRWLADIGFVPGERVQVMARAPWGGDPLVVRVGQSTFALRDAEAACVRVAPLSSECSATSLEPPRGAGRAGPAPGAA